LERVSSSFADESLNRQFIAEWDVKLVTFFLIDCVASLKRLVSSPEFVGPKSLG
jgi:hypothetical protein